MANVTINGVATVMSEELTVLQAAAAQGIRIPTLCCHEGLEPYGGCRLCLVEIEMRGRTRLESACTRGVEEGMVIRTDTDQVRECREMIVELLLARCPDSARVQELAREVGVAGTRFSALDEDCVLCGLCVRACQDAIGVSAISFLNRGADRKVATPFCIDEEVCVGCGACARVCPTGAIEVEDVGDKRYLRYFGAEVPLQACSECGEYFTAKRFSEKTAGEFGVTAELHGFCQDCRRKHASRRLRRHLV